MTSAGSVTLLLRQLPEKDQAAFQKLWEAYFPRLVGLARRRLQDAPRAAADEEDVALSAFASFCRGAEQGRFPRLADRDDLWQVLVLLTCRKASNLVKHQRRSKRDSGRVVHGSALPADERGRAFAELIGRGPGPAFAAEVAEECRRRLGLLHGPKLREVALLKMEGHTNQEIADRLGCSLPTVELKLRRVRKTWEREDER
jgi:DNA-directed RNA polymerase specialized sigma24 family protein